MHRNTFRLLAVFIISFVHVQLARAATPPQPAVAIHVSELTKALEVTPATAPTPTGPGTSGFQWWITTWRYHVMPESLKEALRSDGTPFVEVSDASIQAGNLLYSDGSPRYPICISLASEATTDEELFSLRAYVLAGGTLFLGSSALTRQPSGATRHNFGLSAEMGLRMVNPSLQNWHTNRIFSKVADHRLLAHIPTGSLLWQMPLHAEEIPWGNVLARTQNGAHQVWTVASTDAQVIAQGNYGPLVTVKPLGSGRIIYYGAAQPLLAHGGMDTGMYAYGIFRNAIEWAFESLQVPIVRLSPWRYPYDAAFIIRHDFENDSNSINKIEQSAQAEHMLGVKGDYYFSTGQLRVNMSNSPVTIASLRRAVQNYGATIGSHNGGLKNPVVDLSPDNFAYWHWGLDEALDTFPPGYASGAEYARASLVGSFADLETWLAGTGPIRRTWVSPFFNSTRDGSFQILEQAGVVIAGEQKISPFPHWTLSTQTPGKRFPQLSLPTSEWYLGNNAVQAVEEYDSRNLHNCIDYYFNLGALLNIYGHCSSTTPEFTDYINYALSKPRMWPANSIAIYDWWSVRSPVSLVSTYTNYDAESICTTTVSGVTDPDTAIEVSIPNWSSGLVSISKTLINGLPVDASSQRIWRNSLKIKLGAVCTNVQVHYLRATAPPTANADSYSVLITNTLSIPAPGVLANDTTGSGRTLTAELVAGPVHGNLIFHPDGSFQYLPAPAFFGIDTFSYRVTDGLVGSIPATVTIAVIPIDAAFHDDFTRASDPAPLSPWVAIQGAWSVTGGTLRGTSSPSSYGNAYLSNRWSDCSLQAQFQFGPGAFGGGFGGRVQPNGGRYAAWIYPEDASGSTASFRLVKFIDWWSFVTLQQASLPRLGTSWHTLQLTFQSNHIAVSLDGQNIAQAFDTGSAGIPAFLSGGISADLWTVTPATLIVDNVTVTTLGTPPIPVAKEDAYTTTQGVALSIPPPGVLLNDVAANGGTLTALLVTGTAHGSLNLQSDGSFTYIPFTNFVGADTFTYKVKDGTTDSIASVATITVLPPQPPIAAHDSYVLNGTKLSISAPGVLANDAAASGRSLSTLLVTGPVHGTLELKSDGSFTYIPFTNFAGIDSFTYKANDGITDSANAIVTIAVYPAGVLFSDDFARPTDPGSISPWVVSQGTWTVAGGSLRGASAINTYANACIDSRWTNYSVQAQFQFAAGSFGGGLGGRLAANSGARYALWVYPEASPEAAATFRLVKFFDWWSFTTLQQGTLPTVSTGWHTVRVNFEGNRISGSFDGSRIADFVDSGSGGVPPYREGGITADLWTSTRPTLMAVDDVVVSAILSAPVAQPDSYTTAQDIQFSLAAPGVLANDTGNGSAMEALLVSGPSNGLLVLQTNGAFTYTPAPGFSGTDSFSYRAAQGSVFSQPATVVITVTPPNPAPVAMNDTYSINQNTTLSIPAPGVLSNDTVSGGVALRAILVSGPAQGLLVLNTNGSFTYMPVTGFAGTVAFTYKATDGNNDSSIATVTVVVSASEIIFRDDFTRSTNPGPISPWTSKRGSWKVTGGILEGNSSINTYGYVYFSTNWTDYSVSGKIRFTAGAFGGGIGGRVKASTGAHYAVWVYPEESPGGSALLKLVKFVDWTGFVTMQQVALTALGTNWHTLHLSFSGNQISAKLDGTPVTNVSDTGYAGTPAYSSGGISAELWTVRSAQILFDDLVVTSP